ncbi:bifunctional nuclease family protein [Bacteroidales bacterium AH-315-I05]|nr:bifunctional nuclease family protein [Bacteroidales bacterium AH-315-I05]
MKSIVSIVVFLIAFEGIALTVLPDTSLRALFEKIDDPEKVEMEVFGFSDYERGAYTVFLKEKNSEQEVLLPIVIGGCEAIALSRQVAGEEFPRPLTYNLFCNMLDSMKIELKAVIISELKNNTFYGIIVLEQNGYRWEMDARPSDAMNLALRKKCKIFSYRKVIDAAGVKR